MGTADPGTFLLSWSQTEIGGLRGAPPGAIAPGESWLWRGQAVRTDDTPALVAADDAAGREALRLAAAAAARRLLGRALPPVRTRTDVDFDDALISHTFTVSDGRDRWIATLIEVAELARPLVMFAGDLPPRDRRLTVVEGIARPGHLNRITDSPTGVICFTPGTLLRTPDGDRPVETLAEGDRIDTRDSGAQEIVWIGRRRMSGARLYAMPELRPVRIRAGALGSGDPQGDLVVSPRHKVLVTGRVARALFDTDEVLVAADDLINDGSIARDFSLREVNYVHLLLPRHHVVWANGVETESFHPASTDLDTVEAAQRARLARIVPGLEDDPRCYGAPARRELSRPEAAILRHEAPLPH